MFVEHYPELVYRQLEHGRLLPGGRALSLDLLKPVSDEPTPLVVFIKGGGFRNVHRARYLPALVGLAQHGVAVASVEYRTSNEARFPAQLDDVQHAIAWLRDHAAELHLRAGAIGVWGNSAGGTLAGLLGADGSAAGVDVAAAVCWYGVHDPALSAAHADADSPIRAVLGPPPAEGGDWFRTADRLHAASAPMLLIHGTADDVVDVEQSIALAGDLERHGIEHELVLVRGVGHSFSTMSTRTDALARSGAFLQRHLSESDAAGAHGDARVPLARR